MAVPCRRRETCRLCQSAEIEQVLSLAPTPIADAFVSADRVGEPQPLFPLDLQLCHACGAVQLGDVIDPDVLWRDFTYVTSSSKGLVEHFRTSAAELVRRARCKPDSLVVDVGSNDGTLLRFFREHGLRVLGVDPARRIAEAATAAGIPTLPEYFTPDLALQIRETHGPAAVLTANNMFAHADNLGAIADAVRTVLDRHGIFTFEVSYLVDILEHCLFDTIYHEHLSYHAVRPLDGFLRRHGLELIEIERIGSKGGSIRGTAQLLSGPRAVSPSVGSHIALEEREGVRRPATYRQFAARLERTRQVLLERLDEVRAAGGTVAGYGASHTVTTLVYHFDLGTRLDFLVDDSLARQGLFSPGHHLPVHSPETLYERSPDAVVVLAWQYADPIIAKHRRFTAQGGRFVIPLPEVRTVAAVAE